ncbi:hypothetical protein MMC19_002830 [Ptychographa xylographoides]|nr:hypothetical protein [Ptychographa xylographoides]
MPAAVARYTVTSPTMPLAMPGKSQHLPLAAGKPIPYRRAAISPPSAGSSVNTSAVPSLTSGSYAGSAFGDHDRSDSGAHGVDLLDMMSSRLSTAIDPLPLDRSLARQAQTSGELNAKQRELAELHAMAQRRMKSTRANLTDGIKAAKDVRKDLEWTQKRVSSLNAKAAKKYPIAYKAASARYPSQIDC